MKLKSELKRLLIFESLSGVGFIVAYFVWIQQFGIQFNATVFYPILCCSVILLQGAIYWGICLNRINGKKRRTKKIVGIYRIFRFMDLIILLFYFLIIYNSGRFERDLLFGIGIYLFAILEYINYFFFRLSYPISELFIRFIQLKFDKSQIAKEIKR